MTTTRVPMPSLQTEGDHAGEPHWIDVCESDQVPEKYLRRVRSNVFRLSEGAREMYAEIATMDGTDDDKLAEVETLGAKFIGVLTAEDADLLEVGNDLTASALITAWSFDDNGKHPTPDAISDLPSQDYRAIQEAVAPAAASLMGPDFDPVPHKVNPDSPTEPSST